MSSEENTKKCPKCGNNIKINIYELHIARCQGPIRNENNFSQNNQNNNNSNQIPNNNNLYNQNLNDVNSNINMNQLNNESEMF